jgi:signal transduction histidine kinase/ligand-binding sensor domain-containing protein
MEICLSSPVVREHRAYRISRQPATGQRGRRFTLHAAIMVVCLALVATVDTDASASPRQTVPVAGVDSRLVDIPVVDARDIRFTRLSTAQGLSQARVAQIVQDDRGFMWFGTQYGLNRYDGHRFKVFTHDPGDPTSLGGVYIYSLFRDRSGVIWVGGDQVLDRFDPVTDTFVHYLVDNGANGIRPTILHISQDRQGVLWLSSGSGLYSVDPGSGRTRWFGHDPGRPVTLSSNDVKSTGEDRSGTFWVATGEGLDAFDRDTGAVTLHIPLTEQRELSFYEDRAGVFWIVRSTGNGLAVFDRKSNRLTRYTFSGHDPSSTALTGVISALEDRHGTMWFGTLSDGILKFDRDRQRFVRYRNYPDDFGSLAENRITTLFEDREGNIWTGLGATEPNFFVNGHPAFSRLPHEADNPANLGETLVNAIYEAGDGIVWIGTTGALTRFDRKSGQYGHFDVPGHPAIADVLAILEKPPGVLWFGTSGQGLYRLDLRTGRLATFRHDPADPGSLSHDVVPRLLIDHAGTLWATTGNGLNKVDATTGRFRTYKRDAQSLREYYISIAEDEKGSLWLGSTSGLVRFDPPTGSFTVFAHGPDDVHTLSNNRVNAIHVDRSHAIWAGTQSGLSRLDPLTGALTSFYERPGLSRNAVGCVLEDEHGNLWMSTNKGVSQFIPSATTFTNYSVADGLPGDDLTGWGACFKSVRGEMFFGGFSGGTAFYPDQISDSVFVPPIVLTDLQVSGVSASVRDGSLLQKSIGYTLALTLSHQQQMFALEFSALSYSNPATNRYRYRLEGLDSAWHEVGSDHRLVSYTTLPAGSYTFRVQGATSRGPWSEPGATLRVQILPPWWSTWWFRVIYVVLFLLLLLAMFVYRARQIAHQFDIRLEERVGERTRIARELHDSLLQGFQGLMFRLQAVRDLLPARAADAIHVLDTALDRADHAIAEGRLAVEDLRGLPAVNNDLVATLTALRAELDPSDDRHSAPTFRVLAEGGHRPVDPIIRDEIYRIAREALRNVFRHADADHIEAEINYGAADFRLRIRDDGRGIDPKILDRGGRELHWGLPGMRERAQGFGGRLDVWSKHGAGTEVELTIPAAIAYSRLSMPGRFLWWRKTHATKPCPD